MSVAKWRRGVVSVEAKRGARATRDQSRQNKMSKVARPSGAGARLTRLTRACNELSGCRGHHFPQSSMGAVRVPGLAISRHEPGSLGSKRALATPARRFSTRHTLGGRPLSWLRARPPRWRCHVWVFGLTAVLMLMLVLVLVPVVLMFKLMAAVCLSNVQADRACCQPVSPAQRPPNARPAPSLRCRSGTTCACLLFATAAG
jgi:hypothetical protein